MSIGSKMRTDPVRFEVMRHSFTAAADEMAAALRKAAYSINIKTRGDFSCALFDSKLRLIAQSFSQPAHLGGMSRMVPSAVTQYGVENLNPGDAIIMNHSYRGGVHLNDVAVIAPFFEDGTLAGYVATIAHHVDIGGYAPGGYCISTEIYQEGVIIPAVKLVANGELVKDVHSLILENIRSPRQSTGDLRAQIAATLLGQRRTREIVARFGRENIETFVDELIEYAQRWGKAELSALPEGDYEAECEMDDDGITNQPIKLRVKVTLKDGRVFFDLTGCDAQRPSPMNATLTQTYSAASYVIKCLIDPEIPTNEGFYRLIEVHAPEGTVVNAKPPVGVVGGWEVAMKLCDLTFKALSSGMPEKVIAATKGINCHMSCGGRDPRNGEYYTFMETVSGGYGGSFIKDGMDAVQTHIQNTENSAIEETENNYPFMISRYELITDSEGAGRFRGGVGVRRDWKFPGHSTTVTVFSDNRKNRPWGLFGGGSSTPSSYILNPDSDGRELPSKITITLPPDSVLSYRTPGGGGYGPPDERDPEAVLADVLSGKVSKERGATVYRVAITSDNKIDVEQTAQLRHK